MAATIAMSCDASEFESSNVVSVRLVPEADVGGVFAIVHEIDQLVDTTADNLSFGHDDSSLARVQYLPRDLPSHSFVSDSPVRSNFSHHKIDRLTVT